MFESIDLTPVWVTLKLATLTTIILLIIGTPIAWWLAHTRCWCKSILQAIISLPLVLPPTVLGFYLLLALGPNGWIGQIAELFSGRHLAFSFIGLVIGSVIASAPFVIQPLQDTFTAIGKRPLEVAATLRASPLDRFFTVVLPLSRHGFITAATLCFTHTIGEFGIVLMIGGNLHGETKVISIAIFEHVEMLEFYEAHLLAGGMLLFSFVVLLTLYTVNRRYSMT